MITNRPRRGGPHLLLLLRFYSSSTNKRCMLALETPLARILATRVVGGSSPPSRGQPTPFPSLGSRRVPCINTQLVDNRDQAQIMAADRTPIQDNYSPERNLMRALATSVLSYFGEHDICEVRGPLRLQARGLLPFVATLSATPSRRLDGLSVALEGVSA